LAAAVEELAAVAQLRRLWRAVRFQVAAVAEVAAAAAHHRQTSDPRLAKTAATASVRSVASP
jgi:hypothetical protein